MPSMIWISDRASLVARHGGVERSFGHRRAGGCEGVAAIDAILSSWTRYTAG